MAVLPIPTALIAKKAEVARNDCHPFAELPRIDCENPVVEYQKWVCGDPLLRQQEERILISVSGKSVATSSAANPVDIGSKFLEFRTRLNGC